LAVMRLRVITGGSPSAVRAEASDLTLERDLAKT
jgi:hypothetical protein